MGTAQATPIRSAVAEALETLHEQEVTEQALREQIAPYVEAAERLFPQYLIELREMGRAADVPFDVLFRWNCYESRPPGSRRPGERRARGGTLPAKDPAVLAQANAEPVVDGPLPVASGGGGCTSVVSRGERGFVVGHTEDSWPEAMEGLYLLDATVEEPDGTANRFKALNYAQTLPGCAAAVNGHGLIVLIDALPDPERNVGAPRHVVSRALLDAPAIEPAIDLLRSTERGGGWNYLLVQGERMANVEATATRVVVTESGRAATFAHTNHYLDPALAAAAGEGWPNSLARLARATELVRPDMSLDDMKRLLSDRQGFPDSICRERTIGAFVAATAARRIEVCWGEPDTGTWSAYGY